MRDLHDAHVSDMMLDLTGERRPVPQMGPGSPGAAAGGDFTGPATHVWSGGGNGAGGASVCLGERYGNSHDGRFVCTASDVWRMAQAQVDVTWDTPVALARAEPPVPIAGAEPWVEGDEAYRARLNRHRLQPITTPDHALDIAGSRLCLPRARLARKEG